MPNLIYNISGWVRFRFSRERYTVQQWKRLSQTWMLPGGVELRAQIGE